MFNERWIYGGWGVGGKRELGESVGGFSTMDWDVFVFEEGWCVACAMYIRGLFLSYEYAAYKEYRSIVSPFSNQQAILFYPLVQPANRLQAEYAAGGVVS